ncbi:MAG: protein translocase subunit SecF [Armatimonadota bacterium]|nr:protein translocase subunit SecF [Armatimonadota bacterium]
MWNVIGRRWIGYVLSVLFILPGVVALFSNAAGGRGALNWGVDFTGGNYFQVRLAREDASVGEVRDVVDRFTAGQSVIQKSDRDVFIRTRPLTPADKSGLLAALRQAFGGATVLREDEVGPTIGRELRNTAIIGIILGLVLQLIYVSVRFRSVRYAVTMDLALLHDLLIVVGVFAITRMEVNSSFVAVLLTVVGYSINDKIVLFDRIRENLAMRLREPFDRLVNRSLLESLVRSINTSVTVIVAIAAVYFFGGVTVRDLAFGLTVGVAVSAYSSIFNAGALLVEWDLWSARRAGRQRAVLTPVAPGTGTPAPVEAAANSAAPAPARSGSGNSARRRRSRRR